MEEIGPMVTLLIENFWIQANAIFWPEGDWILCVTTHMESLCNSELKTVLQCQKLGKIYTGLTY